MAPVTTEARAFLGKMYYGTNLEAGHAETSLSAAPLSASNIQGVEAQDLSPT